jgi:hypothetical protein
VHQGDLGGKELVQTGEQIIPFHDPHLKPTNVEFFSEPEDAFAACPGVEPSRVGHDLDVAGHDFRQNAPQQG